ncbi:hypothetical protein MKX03_009004 [Papaver bracteatum]|nr:hypothetical protein MKX03_009004 [Papaver bracteatum]
MSFVFFDFPRGSQKLNYAEYHEDDKSSDLNFITKRIKINLDFLTNVSRIVDSCNGLICFSVKTKYRNSPSEPLYLCNPITREIVNLPGLSIHKKEHKELAVRIAHGFGYHPLTNEYKVVRICYILGPNNKYSKGQVEVYTLGSDSRWRRKGETSHRLCGTYRGTNSGVSFNGAIHWLNLGYMGIVAFDLASEDFDLLPAPMDYSKSLDKRSLRVMRGNLSLFSEYSFSYDNPTLEFVLWVLQKNKEEINDTTDHMKQLFKYKSWGMERCSYRDAAR